MTSIDHLHSFLNTDCLLCKSLHGHTSNSNRPSSLSLCLSGFLSAALSLCVSATLYLEYLLEFSLFTYLCGIFLLVPPLPPTSLPPPLPLPPASFSQSRVCMCFSLCSSATAPVSAANHQQQHQWREGITFSHRFESRRAEANRHIYIQTDSQTDRQTHR